MNELHTFFKNNAELISILCFLAGLLWGNRLAIGRDKRKEFIELTKDTRLSLERQISTNYFLSQVDFGDKTLVASHFGNIKRRKFFNLIKKYEYAYKNIEAHDSVPYAPTFDEYRIKEIAVLSRALIKFFKPG